MFHVQALLRLAGGAVADAVEVGAGSIVELDLAFDHLFGFAVADGHLAGLLLEFLDDLRVDAHASQVFKVIFAAE